MKKTTKKIDGRGRPKTTGIFGDRDTLELIVARLRAQLQLTVSDISDFCGINWMTCRTILRDKGML